MKIKSGFVLHPVGIEYIVVAVGERTAEFSGMLRLNDTGAFLWNALLCEQTEQTLAAALIEEYGISEQLAIDAVSSFTAKLKAADVMEQ